MRHTGHTALGYSVHTVSAKSIKLSFFRFVLGLINRFDVLTYDDSIFTTLLIVYQ